jgi:hypothetical protein
LTKRILLAALCAVIAATPARAADTAVAAAKTVAEKAQEDAKKEGPPAPPPKAAATEPTLQSDVSDVVRRNKAHSRFITFNSENDLYGNGADRNYTNGARLTYFDFDSDIPDFARVLDKLVPTFSINDTTGIYYSVGQNLYTPSDIKIAADQKDDRPWAAFLYTSAGLASITKNHVDNIEATIGVVGPAALGEQTQKFIHSHVSDSPLPKGWRHQLKNEPGLILSWERSWPERYGFQTFGLDASAVPYLGATVGNVYTYANTGVSFRLMPHSSRFQDTPVRVRPAMPGTGAFVVPDGTLGWYLFSGVEGRAVARNIFLDGNTFADSDSVDKLPFVADLNAGLAITYGRVRTSYAIVYRTKEFHEQDSDGDVFGTITLGIRF